MTNRMPHISRVHVVLTYPPPIPSHTATVTIIIIMISVTNTTTTASTVVTNDLVVCLLCQRQFLNFEQLQRHERESKLHKDNLLKLQQSHSNHNQNP